MPDRNVETGKSEVSPTPASQATPEERGWLAKANDLERALRESLGHKPFRPTPRQSVGLDEYGLAPSSLTRKRAKDGDAPIH